MAKGRPRGDTGRETTPKEFPEVLPPTYGEASQSAWVLESMMQIQKSIGEMQANIGSLIKAVDKQGSKVDNMSHILYATSVVLVIVLAIASFLITKYWDGIVVLLAKPR